MVRALEEAGVGRPSTYAPTLRLLLDRAYCAKEVGARARAGGRTRGLSGPGACGSRCCTGAGPPKPSSQCVLDPVITAGQGAGADAAGARALRLPGPFTSPPSHPTRTRAPSQGKALVPTPLGRVLSAFLACFFSEYVDAGFTSRMEEQLDDVSGARAGWAGCGRGWGWRGNAAVKREHGGLA
jgi:hypothetical protein